MARQGVVFLAFNRGLVSRLALARADIKRVALSAEVMINCMPRVMGSMMLRPGLKYLGSTASNAAARFLPFVFSSSDKAALELTDILLRIWISDALLTRPAVTSAVTNGTFASNDTGWADADQAGATSSWVSASKEGFTGTGTNAAIRTQTVAVVEAGVEHALRVVVERGPLTLRVGSAAGGDEYISETELGTGTHSLAFTPSAGSFYIQFSNRLARIVYLTSCTVEAAGVVTLPTPWLAADLGLIRGDQSGDVVFVACKGYQQRRIERRGSGRSWSIILYLANDGPFRVANVGATTMTPSALSGNGTLTASLPTFKSTQVGALFAVTSTGQTVTKSMGVVNDATNSIRLTGVTTDRAFTITLTGLSATGNTVILQRSFDDSVWAAVSGKSWTANTSETYTDGLDNQIVYYRLLCSVYATGTTVATLNIALGSIRGIARVTAFTTNVLVSIEILSSFGGTSATNDWEEGAWSDYRGWPGAVCLYEGRLWWFGKDKVNGSVSDTFNSFDTEYEGDAGPISRSIGSGPVDTINWALPLQRLLVGGEGTEFSCRSTSFDEPLTPTNFNIKKASTQGSASVAAVTIDSRGIFVQRGGTRVFELAFDGNTYDYASSDLTAIVPGIGKPRIVRMAVQRQPDTRIHCVRSDGTAAVLVYDKTENVTCWIEIASDGASGLIEDVMILPGSSGTDEDQVYYVVNRTIGGATKRYFERWAMEEECFGDEDLCLLADSYVTYEGVAATVITGLTHLEGKQVVVWADGADVGTDDDGDLIYTVASGQITLAVAATDVVVGLYYRGRWKSGKLVQAANAMGIGLNQHKLIDSLGLILANAHSRGLKYGRDFDNLDDMPGVESGAIVTEGTVWEDIDTEMITFPGSWGTDSRICLEMAAPRPCTVLSVLASVHTP